MRKAPVFLAAALLAPLPALAHGGADHAHGVVTGFLHPLGGPDHLAAMVALGACAGLAGGRTRLLAPASFIAAMLAGCVAGAAGFGMPMVEAGILASVILLGGLLAVSLTVPATVALAGSAVFGLLHGSAHGIEMAGAPVTAFAGMLAATAMLHGAGLMLAVAPARSKSRLALRLAGGASAAAAIGSLLLPVW